MSAPKFFTDEDVYSGVAAGLRKAGLDAVSTPETGRLGESDESQLGWAAQEGRVLVSFNVVGWSILATGRLKGRRGAAAGDHDGRRRDPRIAASLLLSCGQAKPGATRGRERH